MKAELEAISMYESIAKRTDDERIQRIFESVANEEKHHLAEFGYGLRELDKKQIEADEEGIDEAIQIIENTDDEKIDEILAETQSPTKSLPKSEGKSRVDVGDEYYHVRQTDPDKYSKVRIPEWAENVAESISKNAKVKMAKIPYKDEWEVQSVLITTDYHSKDKARELATRIKNKIEE